VFVPTPEQREQSPLLAACFVAGLSERETIDRLYDALSTAERTFQEHVARCAKPVQVPVVSDTWFDHNGRAWTRKREVT